MNDDFTRTPELYTLPFLSAFFGYPKGSRALKNAVVRHALRVYGQVDFQHGVWVVTAKQIWQYRNKRRAVYFHELERCMRLYHECMKRGPSEHYPHVQRHIDTTEVADLRWLSNYVHHGGKTKAA